MEGGEHQPREEWTEDLLLVARENGVSGEGDGGGGVAVGLVVPLRGPPCADAKSYCLAHGACQTTLTDVSRHHRCGRLHRC